MFVRKKKNRSGTTSVVVVDKHGGKFKELCTSACRTYATWFPSHARRGTQSSKPWAMADPPAPPVVGGLFLAVSHERPPLSPCLGGRLWALSNEQWATSLFRRDFQPRFSVEILSAATIYNFSFTIFSRILCWDFHLAECACPFSTEIIEIIEMSEWRAELAPALPSEWDCSATFIYGEICHVDGLTSCKTAQGSLALREPKTHYLGFTLGGFVCFC